MSQIGEIELAALLCSRLCHDLISPVGAISNGIEILADEDDELMRAEVMKLLDQSAQQTSNRLKFFRLSFGAAGGFGSSVLLEEAKMAITGLLLGTRAEMIWNSNIGVMDKNAIKMMLNMVLISSETMVRGGQLQIDINTLEDETSINMTISGSKIIFQEKVKTALLNDVPLEDLDTKTVPAFLAREAANRLEAKIKHIEHENAGFSLSVSF